MRKDRYKDDALKLIQEYQTLEWDDEKEVFLESLLEVDLAVLENVLDFALKYCKEDNLLNAYSD